MHEELAPKYPGILPFVASNINESPDSSKPIWLATRIAKPMKNELAEKTLVEVVTAVHEIASTLAALHAENITHRDLKPNNLYSYDGRWVIGDLGLLDFPDKESITGTSERIGPQHYIPPEMARETRLVEPTKADVYCLAKTLWVLATRQNIPPGGELRTDNRQLCISGFAEHHPRVRELDLLVENCTRHDPTQRPTMSDFARQLNAWLQPTEPPSAPDISRMVARLQALSESHRKANEIRNQQRQNAENLLQQMKDWLSPISKAFTDAGFFIGDPVSNNGIECFPPPILAQRIDSPPVLWERVQLIRGARLAIPGVSEVHVGIDCLFGIELLQDSTSCLRAGYTVQTSNNKDWVGYCEKRQATGTPEETNSALEIANHLTNKLPEALEKFLQLVEKNSGL